jgi:hypothetical protein
MAMEIFGNLVVNMVFRTRRIIFVYMLSSHMQTHFAPHVHPLSFNSSLRLITPRVNHFRNIFELLTILSIPNRHFGGRMCAKMFCRQIKTLTTRKLKDD